MFAASSEGHSLQEAPRTAFWRQCASEARPSLTVPKSSVAPPPGILDMTFNRRSLDWSELQSSSPHSTCDNQQHFHSSPTDSSQSTGGDLYQQLSHWNFPPQPSVPPRLVLWGPFDKTAQNHPQFQPPPHSAQTYHPPTSFAPPHGCKASKRGREGYLPSTACLSKPSSALPSKRPRTAEQDAYKFPPIPTYTAYQTSAYPTPVASPTNQSLSFHTSHSMAEDSLSISPLSISPRSFPEFSLTDSNRLLFRDPSPAYSPHTHAQQSAYPPASKCNFGYYSNPPISPTTPLSMSPLSINSVPFHTPSNNGSHQLNIQNPQYPSVWSPEWHQAFNQFRYQQH
ncbi:hypothetical protein VP01_3590g2, partial [Puccinia sorghi]